ncbi:hypothetical protein DW322_11355 [Rhodococcus rhodnii]|uniref:Uncharacterized protein n=2 Tax=Rhodococcus rhodnii TaxID=38312 RepID=R7WS20_9NOCA|nr:hypothetical protein [Rhodococcus rhodnii]EOM78085.1 hypothetical protein Rrhod_0535 [Rhodococcus rhodnii LMG 5362]TXG90705.1 hypothetical protein DW322_11355 [Rhodococcus rhodnii]
MTVDRVVPDVMLLLLAVAATVFALLYLCRSPFWRNRIGKIYGAKTGIMAFVLLQNTLAVWWSQEYPGRHVIRLIIYTLGFLAFIPMIVSLWRMQQEDRRRDETDEVDR